ARIARCRGRPDRRAIPARIRSRDNVNRAPRRARAGRGEEANWSGARLAETAGIAWVGALCGAYACRTTLRSRERARNRGQRLVVFRWLLAHSTFSAATHSDMTTPAAEARRAEEVHWRSSVPVLPLYLRPARAPACVRRGRRCCTRSPVSRSLPTCSMPCAKRAAP